ncbi:hypothetical protein CBL_13586 [Carabus blaptoides fortunei]
MQNRYRNTPLISIRPNLSTSDSTGLCVTSVPAHPAAAVVTVKRIVHPQIMPPILAWTSIDATIKLSLKKGKTVRKRIPLGRVRIRHSSSTVRKRRSALGRPFAQKNLTG